MGKGCKNRFSQTKQACSQANKTMNIVGNIVCTQIHVYLKTKPVVRQKEYSNRAQYGSSGSSRSVTGLTVATQWLLSNLGERFTFAHARCKTSVHVRCLVGITRGFSLNNIPGSDL